MTERANNSNSDTTDTDQSALEFTYKRFLQCSLTSFNKDNFPTKIYLGKHNQKLLPTHWKRDGGKKLSECVVWVSDPSTIIYRLQNDQDISLTIDLNDFKMIGKRDTELQKEILRLVLLCSGLLGENTSICMSLSDSEELNNNLREFLPLLDKELNLNSRQMPKNLVINQKLNPPEMFDAYKKLAGDPKKAITAIHNDVYPGTVYLLSRDSASRLKNIINTCSNLLYEDPSPSQIDEINSIVKYEMDWIHRSYYLTLKIAETKSGIIPIPVIKWVWLVRAIGINITYIIEAIRSKHKLLKNTFLKNVFLVTNRILTQSLNYLIDSLDGKEIPIDIINNLFHSEMVKKLYRYIEVEPELHGILSEFNFLFSQLATLNKYLLYQERLSFIQVNSEAIDQIQDMKHMIFISKFDKNFLNIPTKIQRTLGWKKETSKNDYESRESTVIDMYMPNNDTIVFQKPNISSMVASIDLNSLGWPSIDEFSIIIKEHGIKIDESAKNLLYKNSCYEILKTMVISGSLINSNVDVNLLTSTDPDLRKLQLEACSKIATYANGQNQNKSTATGYLFSFKQKRKTIQSIFFSSLENFDNVYENSTVFFEDPNLDTFVQLEDAVENTYNKLSNNYSSIASISVSRGAVKLFIYFMSLRIYKIGNNLKQSCEDLKRILYNKEIKDYKPTIELLREPFLEHLQKLTDITEPLKNNQAQMDSTKEFTNLSFEQLIELFDKLGNVKEDIRDIRKKMMGTVVKPNKKICSNEISKINSYIHQNYVHLESFCKAIIFLNKKNLFK